MAFHHSPKIVTDGLGMYIDAANPKSYSGTGALLVDLTGNGYNVTMYNSPNFNSNIGYISFNGVNQYGYHTFPAFEHDEQDYSIEIWFKMRTLPAETYGSNGHIFGGENGNDLVLYLNPAVSQHSKLNMVYDDSRYNTNHESDKRISANEWVHWIVQGTPSQEIQYYVNGELDKAFFTSVDSSGGFSSPAKIARDTRWGTYSELDVSVIKYYSRVLTALEVKQNYEALKGRFGL